MKYSNWPRIEFKDYIIPDFFQRRFTFHASNTNCRPKIQMQTVLNIYIMLNLYIIIKEKRSTKKLL